MKTRSRARMISCVLWPCLPFLMMAQTVETYQVGNVACKMVFVEGGSFWMGATDEQGEDAENDETVHLVKLDSYYIGQVEVTQALWREVTGENPSTFSGYNSPVDKVSWNDVQVFIKKLNRKTGKKFRLPTEAEWEYAARGGQLSKKYKYSGSNSIGNVAWYEKNSGSSTHSTGKHAPNELGIYDMSGNVWEWCNDWYKAYDTEPQDNPQGPETGEYRVLRGGGWYLGAKSCRVSFRDGYEPTMASYCSGFRLAMSVQK